MTDGLRKQHSLPRLQSKAAGQAGPVTVVKPRRESVGGGE